MKFTFDWLRDHLDTTATLDQIVDRLSIIGLEVESVEEPAKALSPFVVARVVDAKQHPNADKLRVCQVDTGAGVVEVVCGAPNARTGMIGVFAPLGSYIPGTGITLDKRPVRGVVSNGMLVSERELELSEDHEGIIDLGDAYAGSVGKRYVDILGLGDPVVEVKLTPNRPDCTGVRGIARDIAACGLGTLKPERKTPGVEGTFDCPVDIRLEFPPELKHACPVFAGRYLRGIKNGVVAGMDAGAAQGDRAPADQRRRRCDELRQHGRRPPAPRLRRRQAGRRHPRPQRPQRRALPRPRRQGARGRGRHVRHRRRQERARLRRHHGWRALGFHA